MVRFRRARGTLQQAVDELIRSRLADRSPPNDLLSALLSADGAERDLAAVRDEVTTLWVAAYVTTGHALAWALDCLARNPSAQDALAQEADEVLGGRVQSTPDVGRLTWSRGVFAESLRLYPPAWILSRHAGGNASISGTHIPRGTLALACPLVTHRDARWYLAPLVFDPGRWLSGQPGPKPFAYFPFGAGVRRCVGEPLAWLEGTLVLAILASRWSFHPVGGAEPSFRRGITLASRHGLPVRIHRRHRGSTDGANRGSWKAEGPS
jgi:cytochrome P450